MKKCRFEEISVQMNNQTLDLILQTMLAILEMLKEMDGAEKFNYSSSALILRRIQRDLLILKAEKGLQEKENKDE